MTEIVSGDKPCVIVVEVEAGYIPDDGDAFDAVQSALEHFNVPTRLCDYAAYRPALVEAPAKNTDESVVGLNMALSNLVGTLLRAKDEGTFRIAIQNLGLTESFELSIREAIAALGPDGVKAMETEHEVVVPTSYKANNH